MNNFKSSSLRNPGGHRYASSEIVPSRPNDLEQKYYNQGSLESVREFINEDQYEQISKTNFYIFNINRNKKNILIIYCNECVPEL